jgi:hypothetical protein
VDQNELCWQSEKVLARLLIIYQCSLRLSVSYKIISKIINVYFINNNTAPALLIYCHLLMIVYYTFGEGQAYAIAKFDLFCRSNIPIIIY